MWKPQNRNKDTKDTKTTIKEKLEESAKIKKKQEVTAQLKKNWQGYYLAWK